MKRILMDWKALVSGVLLWALNGWCATTNYQVAAYYFPNYHPNSQNEDRYGKGWTEWELIKVAMPRFPGHGQPKVPLWGYEDESNPAVFAKKIDAAADYGVTAFIFDWYWHDTGPFLERGLEQGFLKARNRERLAFALMWANHDWLELFPAKAGVPPQLHYPGSVSRETFDKAVGHIITHYFSQTNYWKLEGKPYFSIYELMTLVKGLGGMDKTRDALESFRARTKAAGFPGLHLNAVAWGVQPPAGDPVVKTRNDMVKALGIDSITSYCWIHHSGPPGFPSAPYDQWARSSTALWDGFRKEWAVPYFPNVSTGWDSSPRTVQTIEFKNYGYPYTPIVVGNTPAEFKKALGKVRAFLDQSQTGPKIFTINAWNEWTEGSYLEPDTVNGFGYLDAIKSVFPPSGK